MMRILRRLLGSSSPIASHAEELEALQRRCAALERALDEQRNLTDAVLYAMGHSPNTYRERARRDLAVWLAKGRDAAPFTLLEPFELGVDAWHAEMTQKHEGRAPRPAA
jgi:hypothetical protein